MIEVLFRVARATFIPKMMTSRAKFSGHPIGSCKILTSVVAMKSNNELRC